MSEEYQQISGFCSETIQLHLLTYSGVIRYDHQLIFNRQFTVILSTSFVFLTRKILK
jgi:hypothetical protein